MGHRIIHLKVKTNVKKINYISHVSHFVCLEFTCKHHMKFTYTDTLDFRIVLNLLIVVGSFKEV